VLLDRRRLRRPLSLYEVQFQLRGTGGRITSEVRPLSQGSQNPRTTASPAVNVAEGVLGAVPGAEPSKEADVGPNRALTILSERVGLCARRNRASM